VQVAVGHNEEVMVCRRKVKQPAYDPPHHRRVTRRVSPGGAGALSQLHGEVGQQRALQLAQAIKVAVKGVVVEPGLAGQLTQRQGLGLLLARQDAHGRVHQLPLACGHGLCAHVSAWV